MERYLILTQTLVFAVPCEYLLLLSDKFGRGNEFLRNACIYRHFLCVFCLLICDLTDTGAGIVKSLFFCFELIQLITDTDDFQKGISFILCSRLHKLRQI